MFSSYGGDKFGSRQFTYVKHNRLPLSRIAWQMAASVFNVWVWMTLLLFLFLAWVDICTFGVFETVERT